MRFTISTIVALFAAITMAAPATMVVAPSKSIFPPSDIIVRDTSSFKDLLHDLDHIGSTVADQLGKVPDEIKKLPDEIKKLPNETKKWPKEMKKVTDELGRYLKEQNVDGCHVEKCIFALGGPALGCVWVATLKAKDVLTNVGCLVGVLNTAANVPKPCKPCFHVKENKTE